MEKFTFRITEDFFSGVPKRLELSAGSFCYVTASNGKIHVVLRDKCSHMGGVLTPGPSGFSCRTHGWMYDSSGKNVTPSNASLTSLDFEVVDGKISIFEKPAVDLLPHDGSSLDGSESLELLAHASFLLSAKKAGILFDPWFTGDAYWGSWRLWPKSSVKQATLESITHVIVSHPHPDHFNRDSLALLDRSVKFLFPDYLSRIIPDTLESMGFTSLEPVPWETKVEVSPDVQLAFLRPNTVWEDSAVLVRVNDWQWLNQVDAGSPLDDSLVPHGLDLLSSSFDTGASGYPLTYEMSLAKKTSIVGNAKGQVLTSISQRCDAVGAKYFAPFAGWWRHGLVEHQELAALLDHTTLEDLEALFSKSATTLLATIPSSKLNLKSMKLVSDAAVERLMSSGVLTSSLEPYVAERRDSDLVAGIRESLQNLSSTSLAARSENVIFKVRIQGLSETMEIRFGEQTASPITVSVEIPRRIAELLLSDDKTVTWNHIDIGYWGSWSRDSDHYPSNFMRLLQLGYVSAFDSQMSLAGTGDVLAMNVAEAIEIAPEVVSQVLGRAGLPCVSCQHSISDTIDSAFNIHRVGKIQRDVALAELGAVIAKHQSQ